MATSKTPQPRKTTAARATGRNVTTLDDAGAVVERTEGNSVSFDTTAPTGNQVTVIVPKSYKLTRDDGAVIAVEAGTQEMDEGDAEHWFSRAMGVKIYDPKAKD